jgi:hypothetical protein
MQSAVPIKHPPRSQHRQNLRTLTYVTLDAGNGGIIRNVNRRGVAVQAVARLRERQRVRLRFELCFPQVRLPRVRVDAWGEVSWATPSGQCGIRFVDLPRQTALQIDQWIFSNLLETATVAASDASSGVALPEPLAGAASITPASITDSMRSIGRWLAGPMAGPLTATTLARLVDGLVLISAWLIFALIFLSITHELPRWPLALAASVAAAAFVFAAYWGVFKLFAGASVGAQLARSAESAEQ